MPEILRSTHTELIPSLSLKACYVAYGRFWSSSPAAEKSTFIFKTILLCLVKSIMNMSFLLFKYSKRPFSTSRVAQRGSLCIHYEQQGCAPESERLITLYLTLCHCHFFLPQPRWIVCICSQNCYWCLIHCNCFQQIFFITTNDNKSEAVKPNECGWTECAVWLLIHPRCSFLAQCEGL